MELPVEFIALKRVEHWNWLKRRAAPVLCEDTKGIVALRGDKVLAIAGFDSWSYNACLAHIAIENPMVLRHDFLGEICRYVFETCERGLMLGLTPADNKAALAFNNRVGMKEVYRIENGYRPGVDYVLQELRRESCRWLKHGFRETWSKRRTLVKTSSRTAERSIRAA